METSDDHSKGLDLINLVTSKIAQGVTPLFRKMAFKIRTGELTPALEESVCDTDPSSESGLESDPALVPANFQCGTSTRFRL
jgi:hypothetical protein